MNRTIRWAALACGLTAWGQIAGGQNLPQASVPARIVVSIGHFYSHEPPVVTDRDLTVSQQMEPRQITRVTALRGDLAALELYILVDDCASCEATNKFEELRRFIDSQAPTTAVGVAYIREGQLEIAAKPTRDHAQVVKALNVPTGGRPANPYAPVRDLIAKWNRDPGRDPQARRALLMFSNGIDPAVSTALLNPTADAAIEAAQRAEIPIFALYNPSADYVATEASAIYAGQVQLAHVGNETGGEAYLLGFGPLPSLAPFLADIADHLANQYLVEFMAIPAEHSGLQDVTIKSQLPDVELMAPARVWVAGSGVAGEGQ